MAVQVVTRRCGHTERVQVYGPMTGRARKVEYEAGRVCTPCYRGQTRPVAQTSSTCTKCGTICDGDCGLSR